MRYYDIEVAGTKRALKLCPINQDLCIAAFLILGDTELTVNCAAALLERAPKYDFLLTAEAKSIPLVQEMALRTVMHTILLLERAENSTWTTPSALV